MICVGDIIHGFDISHIVIIYIGYMRIYLARGGNELSIGLIALIMVLEPEI